MVKTGSFVILFKDDTRKQVFLVLRSDFPVWNLTGGGVEKGESLRKAAEREALEEANFNVKVLQKIGCYRFFDKKGNLNLVSHLYEGRIINGHFKPEYPGCAGKWFEVDNLPTDITKDTVMRIFDAKTFKKKTIERNILSNFYVDNWNLFLRHPFASIKYLVIRRKRGN